MDNKRLALGLGAGCLVLLLLAAGFVAALMALPGWLTDSTVFETEPEAVITAPVRDQSLEVEPIPLPTESEPAEQAVQDRPEDSFGLGSDLLNDLYGRLSPGVVNIQVFSGQGPGGQGAGSGFIIDDAGNIVTNNHVIAGANQVIIIFFDGIQASGEVISTDPDSDLAVVRVPELPDSVHPLPIGDSDAVEVGDWVLAIGNPFGLGGSMSLGIVSALGRTIPTGVTPFSIPQAIQTDAAINPGNSGGPLLNLRGEVIGVNAQIATSGALANSGVGFAIPSNVVRFVAPVLVEGQAYQWPWLGVEGNAVNLLIVEANDLESQRGAYIHNVVPGGPAAKAGLRGTQNTTNINGLQAPVGGDVVVEVNSEPVADFDQLLANIAFMRPGDVAELTVLRNGRREAVTVTLEPRPVGFTP